MKIAAYSRMPLAQARLRRQSQLLQHIHDRTPAARVTPTS